jgi:hypothetical protein
MPRFVVELKWKKTIEAKNSTEAIVRALVRLMYTIADAVELIEESGEPDHAIRTYFDVNVRLEASLSGPMEYAIKVAERLGYDSIDPKDIVERASMEASDLLRVKTFPKTSAGKYVDLSGRDLMNVLRKAVKIFGVEEFRGQWGAPVLLLGTRLAIRKDALSKAMMEAVGFTVRQPKRWLKKFGVVTRGPVRVSREDGTKTATTYYIFPEPLTVLALATA